MRFWRSVPGALLLVLLLGCGVAVGAVSLQVHRMTHPGRAAAGSLAVAEDLVRIEEVGFSSSDGVSLKGWRIAGAPRGPAVVLCHDLGSSKEAMLTLGIALQKGGFTVLAFDFRGHGASDGKGSTLGLDEKRDVIGALDYLAASGVEARRIGVYGVGMGAHAAVLAAADRPSASVLVLSGLYPDVRWALERGVYAGWGFGARRLGFLPKTVFDALHFRSRGESSASRVLATLRGRHLLLVAPAEDATLAAEMQRMYETIPDQKDVDGNLVTLPSGSRGDLYGADLERFQDKVLGFFRDRLA